MLFMHLLLIYFAAVVSSTLRSPVQTVAGPVLRFPLAIHDGLAISLLERIPSRLPVSGGNGSSKSEDTKFSGDLVPSVRFLELDCSDKVLSPRVAVILHWLSSRNRSALSLRSTSCSSVAVAQRRELKECFLLHEWRRFPIETWQGYSWLGMTLLLLPVVREYEYDPLENMFERYSVLRKRQTGIVKVG